MPRTEPETTRTCTKCGVLKNLTEFYREKRARNGRRYSCKMCDHERKVRYLTGLSLEEHERQKALRKKHKMTERDYSRRWRQKNLAMALIGHARTRARRLGLPFDLAEHREELQARIDAGKCELSGIDLNLEVGKTARSVSLDRIEPEKGYIYENVRVICCALNFGMSNWGEDELLAIVSQWIKHREG